MGNMGWDFWHHWWWLSWETMIPVLLILAGVAFLFGGRNYVSPAQAGSAAPAAATTGGPASIRRLYRSRAEKKIFGVCGGIGEYLQIDPVIIRILFVLAAFASFGFVLLAYVLMAIIVPYEQAPRAA